MLSSMAGIVRGSVGGACINNYSFFFFVGLRCHSQPPPAIPNLSVKKARMSVNPAAPDSVVLRCLF